MRTFTVPSDIVFQIDGKPVLDAETNLPAAMSFRSFLLRVVSDPLFCKGNESSYKMALLMEAVRRQIEPADLRAGATAVMEDDTWQRAKTTVLETHSHFGLNPQLLHCLVPFIAALLDAKP